MSQVAPGITTRASWDVGRSEDACAPKQDTNSDSPEGTSERYNYLDVLCLNSRRKALGKTVYMRELHIMYMCIGICICV